MALQWFVRGSARRARISVGLAETSGFSRIEHRLLQSPGSEYQYSCNSLRDHGKRLYYDATDGLPVTSNKTIIREAFKNAPVECIQVLSSMMNTAGYSWLLIDQQDNGSSCLGKHCEHLQRDGDSYLRDRSSGLAYANLKAFLFPEDKDRVVCWRRMIQVVFAVVGRACMKHNHAMETGLETLDTYPHLRVLFETAGDAVSTLLARGCPPPAVLPLSACGCDSAC
jgi:hypothetical protein